MSLLDPPPVTSRRSRPIAFTVAALVLIAIVGLWWAFRFYPEKRAVQHFFDALVAGDTATAYKLWKPKPSYKMEDFLADWGPNGYFGPVKSYRILRESSPIGSNAVEVYVHRLRRHLAEIGASVQVHTVRGVGYLIAEGA